MFSLRYVMLEADLQMSESQSLSSSALLSLSVGSIIRAVDTGQDTVGAWKPETAKETWVMIRT